MTSINFKVIDLIRPGFDSATPTGLGVVVGLCGIMGWVVVGWLVMMVWVVGGGSVVGVGGVWVCVCGGGAAASHITLFILFMVYLCLPWVELQSINQSMNHNHFK